jgi:TonB family protein
MRRHPASAPSRRSASTPPASRPTRTRPRSKTAPRCAAARSRRRIPAGRRPRRCGTPLPLPTPDTPVEILSKPTPAYTPEARELKVEGEVVLEVVFVASGEMHVVGIVERLGHGLDEAAIQAAKKIRFRPARRNGLPVDHAAVLRIVFQLA